MSSLHSSVRASVELGLPGSSQGTSIHRNTSPQKTQSIHRVDIREEPLLPSSVPESSSSYCGYIVQWIKNSAWPGMGLFGESYVLFSVGTLGPIWKILFDDCYSGAECQPRLLHSLTYSVVLGVITGMLVLGYYARIIGRRKGSIITASIMCGGSFGLLLCSMLLTNHAPTMFRSISVLLFFFGVGVGGEYPLSASSASERAMIQMRQRQALEALRQSQNLSPIKDGDDHDDDPPKEPETRGRQIQLVFCMQGLGILFNSVTLMLLLWGLGQTNADNYDPDTLLSIWRITYAIGFGILCIVLVSRYFLLQESIVWADDQMRRERLTRQIPLDAESTKTRSNLDAPENFVPSSVQIATTVSSLSVPSVAYDVANPRKLNRVFSTDTLQDVTASPQRILWRDYGVRLMGASATWMLWDIAFYGNKLFQATFLMALTGSGTTLIDFAKAASINAAAAMLGYIGAAQLIDHPMVGRLRLQQFGFLITGGLFVTCGVAYNDLSMTSLVVCYLLSSFFGQLGPNATTFLIPAEIFPTEMRTWCHGICAASGKLGALFAAVLFHFVSNADLFLISGYASFLGCAITFWTLPETCGLDLYEIDKKWRLTLDGRKRDYEGDANNPNFLSYYERKKLGFDW